MIGGPIGDALGEFATMGRTISGRYAIRIDGVEAGSETWRLQRTSPGVTVESTVEIARPVRVSHSVTLELDTHWRSRRLRVVSEGPDATRRGEFRVADGAWEATVERTGSDPVERGGALDGEVVFDFGATVLHFNSLWMDREPGNQAEVDALLVHPDLRPEIVGQRYRFLRRTSMPRAGNRAVEALQQSVVTRLEDRTVTVHLWTESRGIPLRSVVTAAETLSESYLVELKGPRSAALDQVEGT